MLNIASIGNNHRGLSIILLLLTLLSGRPSLAQKKAAAVDEYEMRVRILSDGLRHPGGPPSLQVTTEATAVIFPDEESAAQPVDAKALSQEPHYALICPARLSAKWYAARWHKEGSQLELLVPKRPPWERQTERITCQASLVKKR
jgi:hypothetical protein